VASAETAAEQDGTQLQLKVVQHMVWSYCPADADAPTYACALSHLCGSLAQEPYSPSLGSSQNPGPPKHRLVHSESNLTFSH
jgi:hypothetical protein